MIYELDDKTAATLIHQVAMDFADRVRGYLDERDMSASAPTDDEYLYPHYVCMSVAQEQPAIRLYTFTHRAPLVPSELILSTSLAEPGLTWIDYPFEIRQGWCDPHYYMFVLSQFVIMVSQGRSEHPYIKRSEFIPPEL